MGELRDQLFLEYVNKSLEEVRKSFRAKGTPKKDNRFLIKGITYDISSCILDKEGKFAFEISSKIPQDLLPKKTKIEKYFNSIVKLVKKESKKPTEWKMENIIRTTAEEEFKERDYVKLLFQYAESELYTGEDIETRFKHHQSKNIPLPNIPGVVTPSGKIVLALVEEGMGKFATKNINDLMHANDTVKKEMKAAAKK